MPHSSPTAAFFPTSPVAEPVIVREMLRVTRLSEQGRPTSEEVDRLAVRIIGRLAGRLLRLRISVRHDGFVLQGRVRSYYAKQLVQEAVRKETKLPIAENAVEVV